MARQRIGNPINEAAGEISRRFGISAEIVRKNWPADDIVYVRLTNKDGAEEWVLLDASSDYDKAWSMINLSAQRLLEGRKWDGF